MPIKKVKILKTTWDKKHSLIYWYVQDLVEGKELRLAFPASDIGPAIGIRNEIPDEAIEGFLKQLEGKDVNFDMQSDIKVEDLSQAGGSEKAAQSLDKYPYREVFESILDSTFVVRVFGTDSCADCQRLLEDLSLLDIPYVLIDADADEHEELCDSFDVDILPHIQVISGEGDIQFNHAGFIEAQRIKEIVDGLTQKALDANQSE